MGAWDFESLSGISALSGEIKRQAQMIGYLNAFQLFGVAAAIAIPISFLFTNPNDSANQ
jgi:hypothetical protein